MSGAFNIDIEVERLKEKRSHIKIYCASLTQTWDLEKTEHELKKFHSALNQQEVITRNKVMLGAVPKFDDISGCELFLSRLGCTAAVLRIGLFHDFLEIPGPVREGLRYASHKPFGRTKLEGELQKHPRFIRRGGGKRWMKLTKDERGGSLICYPDQHTKSIVMASIKIGASTELQPLKDQIPNAFVLKSGHRQWVLQASSGQKYLSWQSQILNMLKEFGNEISKNDGNTNGSGGGNTIGSDNMGKTNGNKKLSSKKEANIAKMITENQETSMHINKLIKQCTELKTQIESCKEKEVEMREKEIEMRRRSEKQFKSDKERLIAEYEVKQDNLRGEIEELHVGLENKTLKEQGWSGLKALFSEEEYNDINIDRYLEEFYGGFNGGNADGDVNDDIDDSSDSDDYDDDDKGIIKYYHKHKHLHDHKHIHSHRHLHIHDHTTDKENPKTFTHTHTIAHTITHTNTQFKIKKTAW